MNDPNAQSPCILIVEDNENHRRILKMMLEHQFSHRVIEASDGQQAIDLAQSEKPLLILMDLSIPLVSGMEATQAIHSNPDTTDIPIIAVSSECWDVELIGKMRGAGAADCLDKILLFDHLKPMITAHLEAARAKTSVENP